MFDEFMLPSTGTLCRSSRRPLASLRIRLPWYRSLPISCLVGIDLSVDGAVLPREALSISLGDAFHTLEEAARLHEVQWFVLDEAILRFSTESSFPVGKHDVGISILLRIPYIEPEFSNLEFTQVAKHARVVVFDGPEGA